MIRPSSGFMCVITKNKDSIYYLDVQEQKLDLSEKLCHFVGLSHVFYSLCASSEEGVGATPQHWHQQETQQVDWSQIMWLKKNVRLEKSFFFFQKHFCQADPK